MTIKTPARLRPITVVVTGGAGYIGSILVRQLLQRGHNVVALDRLVYGRSSLDDLAGKPGFKLVEADIRDSRAVQEAMNQASAVVHLAAIVGDQACDLDPQFTQEVNLAATEMIGSTAFSMGISRFVFASTCSVYGASDGILDEESALNPVSLYARLKIEAEHSLLNIGAGGLKPVILRFGTIYGMSPRPRFDLVVNLLAAKAVMGEPITIYGGSQWRPFLHVSDAAGAIVQCLEASNAPIKGQIMNVGSDEENYRIEELGKIIQRLVPNSQTEIQSECADRRDYRVSFRKIKDILGYVTQHTVSLGVEEILDAFRQRNITSYQEARYNNFQWLKQQGAPAQQNENERELAGVRPGD